MWTFEEWKLFWEMLNSMPEFRCGEKPVAETVVFSGIRDGVRTDAVMAKLYDAELAELTDDRKAEKAKVRNRRRADRKHKLTPKDRKEQELMRKDRMYGYAWNLDCPKKRFHPESDPIKTRKYAEGDRINRADWELEQRDIEVARLDAELEAEYAEWERRYRHEKYMQNLNEWLKYA